MKKITASLILLLLFVSVAYSSTALSFSESCTLVGGNGRTIRKTDVTVDASGLVIATGDKKITAEGNGIKLTIGENTICSVIDDGSSFIFYVIDGEGAVSSTSGRSIRIYTPTTCTEAEGSGDYYVSSTENEEFIFNHSSSSIRTYDSIRGTYTEIEADSSLNCITNSRTKNTGSKEETGEIRIPASPVFLTPDRSVTEPKQPSSSMTVTQTLVEIEDESAN